MPKINNINLNLLKDTFEDMDSDRSRLGLNLLEEAKFMKQTLKKLKSKIRKNGVVTEMCQGEYSIDRANPALSQYNSLIKNYQSCIKQICELLPEDSGGTDDDEFDRFNK